MRSRWIDGREQLGQRGGHRLQQRALAHEVDVGFHREARARQRTLPGDDVGAIEAQRVGQHQPALDAALLAAVAVVVEQAMHPLAAQLAVVRAGHQRGVLARHRRLVAVAVERPRLHLALVELAAVQEAMERVLVVVALGADRADGGLQLRRRHQAARTRTCGGDTRQAACPSWRAAAAWHRGRRNSRRARSPGSRRVRPRRWPT